MSESVLMLVFTSNHLLWRIRGSGMAAAPQSCWAPVMLRSSVFWSVLLCKVAWDAGLVRLPVVTASLFQLMLIWWINWWVIGICGRFHKCVFVFFVDICRKVTIVKLLSWSVSFKDNSLLYTSAFTPDWGGGGGDYHLKMILFKLF